MPKTLVTGGTGFLGKNLVQLLLDSGEDLRVLDIHSPPELAEKVEMIMGKGPLQCGLEANDIDLDIGRWMKPDGVTIT